MGSTPLSSRIVRQSNDYSPTMFQKGRRAACRKLVPHYYFSCKARLFTDSRDANSADNSSNECVEVMDGEKINVLIAMHFWIRHYEKALIIISKKRAKRVNQVLSCFFGDCDCYYFVLELIDYCFFMFFCYFCAPFCN